MLVINSTTAALISALLLVVLACAGFMSKDKSKTAVLSTILAVATVVVFVVKQAPIKHNFILPQLVGTLALIVSALALVLAAYHAWVSLTLAKIEELRFLMIPAYATVFGFLLLTAGDVLSEKDRLQPAESYSSFFPFIEITGKIFGNVFMWLILVALIVLLVMWLIDRHKAKKARQAAPTSPAAPAAP